jgi:diketogulonate reductase-like aldo/keto reductase
MSLLTPSTLKIFYGTAWKKDRTKDLVYQAIKSGFRAIDTACQPKHYNERLVNELFFMHYLIISLCHFSRPIIVFCC